MDRQFDFRALLLKIHDRLSNDDRHRLHFLVGDIIPRMQRENVTLAGTLTLLESLFDRAVINEDDLDFLIRIFREIQCYDAVKRLQEYQLSKEHKITISDVLNDNIEDDKHPTIDNDQIILDDKNHIQLRKSNISIKTTTDVLLLPSEKSYLQKMTATQSFSISPKTHDVIDIPLKTIQTQKTFLKLPLINCLYVLFFLESIFLIIYLSIFIQKKISFNIIKNKYQPEAYVPRYGNFRNDINGKWFNHSEELLLTYTDRLIRIDARVYHDDMYSIKFIYSHNKSIEHKLKNLTRLNNQPILLSLNIEQQNIQEITQCYKTNNNNNSTRLVGLSFAFKNKPSILFGSCHEQIYLEDKFPNHIFGYAFGKTTTQYLNGLQFVWYKICLIHSRVTFCANHKPYRLEINSFYKD